MTTLADFAAAVKARVGGQPIGLGVIERPLDLGRCDSHGEWVKRRREYCAAISPTSLQSMTDAPSSLGRARREAHWITSGISDAIWMSIRR